MILRRLISLLILLLLAPVAAADNLPPRIKSPRDGAEMVLIPAGPFEYGYGRNQRDVEKLIKKLKASWADMYATEIPKRTVELPDYYIDRFEVTNQLYGRFIKETRRKPPRYLRWPQYNAPRQPIVGVGWGEAEAYCKWAGKQLPSEEEWEKAARGTDGRLWPWGNEPDDTRYNGKKQANYSTLMVGSFPAGDSPYGVADMAGNVWEMTSSQWKDQSKAMRGGSYLNPPAEARTTVRWAAAEKSAQEGASWLGFRCVMDAASARRSAR
jgi:iron(II)-dependent oxidoreductase